MNTTLDQSVKFEIEPLEERIAPSAMTLGFTENQTDSGPWTGSGDNRVFLGRDPPPTFY